MTQKLGPILSLLLCLVAAPHLWAEEAAEGTPVVDTPARATAPECAPALDTVDDLMKVDLAGCTASYACVHGGTVSCSAPTGTCTSSGQRCGRVTCNGETTWCPGACLHDFNCATFCGPQGSSDGFCDSFGCCVCL